MSVPTTPTPIRFRERAPRFSTDIHMEVKTFGSQSPNELEAINISKSGVLACAFANILPFSNGTILEITIDPNMEKLARPVQCIGKVKRVENMTLKHEDSTEEHKIVLFGIQFTEMEGDDALTWDGFVDGFEKTVTTDEQLLNQDKSTLDTYTLIQKSLLTKQRNSKPTQKR